MTYRIYYITTKNAEKISRVLAVTREIFLLIFCFMISVFQRRYHAAVSSSFSSDSVSITVSVSSGVSVS